MTTSPSSLELFEAQASRLFAPLRITAPDPDSHTGRVRTTRIGMLTLTRIIGDTVTVRRERRLIRSDDPELIKVAWHRAGRAGVQQDDRQCLVRPGQMVAYDTTRPYELPFWGPYEIIVAAVPRTVLEPHAELFRTRTALPVSADAALQRTIGSFVDELTNCLEGDPNAESATPTVRHYLADSLIALIVSAFADTRPTTSEAGSELFERIEAYCLAHLADPDLSVRSVAATHGISVRYLHKLASTAGINLSGWIRRKRLHRIRQDLADPALAHRTPASLASRWGILDAGHLSRSLKAEFGRTPTQIRREARAR